MQWKVRRYLIGRIYDVDKQNRDDIFHDIMHDGFKGYNNMSDIELIKNYIEYYGLKQFELNVRELVKDGERSWDDFVHIAYNGLDEDAKDLYICFGEDFTEWCVYRECMSGDSCFNALIDFGIDEKFLRDNWN